MNGTQTTKFFDRLLFYSWVCRNFCCFIRFLPMQCKREVFSWMWCVEYFVLMFPQSKVRAAFAILAMFYWTGTWDLCNMLAWSGVYAEGHRNGAWRKVEVLNLATLWAAGEMLRWLCKDLALAARIALLGFWMCHVFLLFIVLSCWITVFQKKIMGSLLQK